MSDIEFTVVSVYSEDGKLLWKAPMQKRSFFSDNAFNWVSHQMKYWPPECRFEGPFRVVTADGEVW